MQIEQKQKLILGSVFVALGFGLMQIPFTALVGASAHFTLFDFFGPIVGAFLGSLPGLVTVLVMQIINWAMHGFHTDAATLIRFLPTLAAVLYFSKKSFFQLVLPPVCMLVFLAHPEGRAAAVYTLYWLIPPAMYFLQDRFVFAKALGATFTAHSVGGALWIWAFNMKATLWMSLIPFVWKERGLMAIGITLTYLLFKKVLALLTSHGYVKIATNHAKLTA